MLRTKPNQELFPLYKAELTLRIRNKRNLRLYNQVLDQFQEFLTDNPPSSILAKSFLGKWGKSKPATLHKYLSIIKGFLNWYGEEIDLKVRLPHQIPEYVEDESIQKLIATIKNKQTHKKTIDRDILLIKLAYNSGLRREELANLRVSDILISEKTLIVRKGKGMKDRTIPLPSGVINFLRAYIVDMKPDDKVFNVKPAAVSDKIRRIAKNAGLNIHAHSLRHGYATRLLEKGANIKAVQELLGHSRIGTTEAYLSLLPKHLREAVDLLEVTEKEMEEKKTTVLEKSSTQEQLQQQPVVTLRVIEKKAWPDDDNVLRSEYFSHFIARNEGQNPVIELELTLLDGENKVLEIHRESVLGVQEGHVFKPVPKLSEGSYQLDCKYKGIDSVHFNQTILTFNVSKASKDGEVYVIPGKLSVGVYNSVN
ncbi:tyrosine-type recombinase/integrase [Chloroflexota bacterium]